MKKYILLLLVVFSVNIYAVSLKLIPGFQVCSIEYSGGVFGKVRYRKAGESAWKNSPDLIYVESEKVLRGSLLKLEENTSYELEVKINGKKLYRSFRTRKFEFPVAKTIYLTRKNCGRTFKPKSGNPGAYIRYTAEPGFVFDSGKHSGIGILIDKAQYIILDGITIKGGKFNAVRVRDSKHIVITNCDISGFGQGGVFRPDLDGKYYNAKNNAIWHDAGIAVRGCEDVIIERNFIHDPKTPGNSWFYSHPAGSDGIFIGDTKRAVIRYNDIIGSDKFRWNDAIAGDCNNFSLIGSCAEDAEINGNYFAFGNDDSVELDGGQKNSRFFFNRIEGFFCGVSIAAVRRGPSYIYCNEITRPGDEFGLYGVALKTLCGKVVPWGRAFFFRNNAAGRPIGYPRIAGSYEAPRFTFRENIYPDSRYASMYEVFKEKNYTVDTNDDLKAPDGVPARPVVLPVRGNLLSQDRKTVVFNQPHDMKSQKVSVTYHGKTPVRYKIRMCDAAEHFTVTPDSGVVKPGERVVFTVKPLKMSGVRLHSGAFIFRLADGKSIPVSVYLDSRNDKEQIANVMKNMIPGTVRKDGTKHTLVFDVPEDGKYMLFVRKGDDCAVRLEMKLPEGKTVLRKMKLRSTMHQWDVPAGEKDSNPPLVLKKGRCEIVLQPSRRSSKTPDVSAAYLCSDWHSVLPIVEKFDKLLLKK